MRQEWNQSRQEFASLVGASQISDCEAKVARDARIPMALRRLEDQAEYLHNIISQLTDRLHPAMRASVPEEGRINPSVDPACDMEAFIGRQTESLTVASGRIADLLNRLEL